MYIRFAGHDVIRLGLRGGEPVRCGIFRSIHAVRDNPNTPDWLWQEIRRELDWFNENLPVPKAHVFWVRSQKRYRRQGLCWFRDDANDMINRIFGLRALIQEGGYPIDVMRSSRPGSILYRDTYQIVAKPDRTTHLIRGRSRLRGSPRSRLDLMSKMFQKCSISTEIRDNAIRV